MTLRANINTRLTTFLSRRRPKVIALDSTALKGATYDRRRRALLVHFRNDRTYEYGCVDRGIVRQLRRAESAGAFFNREIRAAGLPYREVPRAELVHRGLLRAGWSFRKRDSAALGSNQGIRG